MAMSLTSALANSTRPVAPNLRLALARIDRRESFGLQLVAGEGHGLLARRG